MYVNLTEVAKAFPKKNLTQIINSQEIKEYCESLSKLQNYSFVDLVVVRKGAPNLGGGTWAHQKVALRVAQKLSPDFAVWVDTRIEELLQHGYTKLDSISRKDLAKMLWEAEEEKEKLQIAVIEQTKELEEAAPKVKFADSVETSKGSILIAELAKLMKQNGIDTGEKRLFKWLRENKFLCSRGEYKNKPTQKSMQDGLFEIKRTVVEKTGMEPMVFSTTKVTGKGQIYFVNRFLANEKAEA